MNSIFKTFLALFLLLPFSAPASEEDPDSYTNYDKIVSDLKSSLHTSSSLSRDEIHMENYSLDDVKISFGMGLSFTHLNLNGPSINSSGLLKGLGLHFGIDLFHPEYLAEGIFRNYTSDSLTRSIDAEVREFELRFVHAKRFPYDTHFRVGAGLSSRYINIARKSIDGVHKRSDTVPSAVFLLGVSRTFGRSLSLGPDISYRSPFSGDHVEEGSIDFHIRASAIF